jgi:hypothetical protein
MVANTSLHGCQHLASVDADVQLEWVGGVIHKRALAQGNCCPHRTHRIVLVGHWRPEDGEDGVTHHVDNRSAKAPDLLAHPI